MAEWARARPALSPVHWPSRFASGWLDALRVPFRGRRGAHAGRADVRARVAHATDKGSCMRFRTANLLMGRDVLRHSLGLPPGGLPSSSSSSAGPAGPVALPAGGLRAFDPDVFMARGAADDGRGALPRPLLGPLVSGGLGAGAGAGGEREDDKGAAAAALAAARAVAIAPGGAAGALPPLTHTPRVLVVRRKDRDIANFDELLLGLRRLPVFVSVFEAEFSPSVPHVIRQFGDADALVAAHGAGMSHMVALRAHAVVVEMFQSALSLCFMRASAAMGLRYWGVALRSEGGDAFTADVGAIVAKLREELGLPLPLGKA